MIFLWVLPWIRSYRGLGLHEGPEESLYYQGMHRTSIKAWTSQYKTLIRRLSESGVVNEHDPIQSQKLPPNLVRPSSIRPFPAQQSPRDGYLVCGSDIKHTFHFHTPLKILFFISLMCYCLEPASLPGPPGQCSSPVEYGEGRARSRIAVAADAKVQQRGDQTRPQDQT